MDMKPDTDFRKEEIVSLLVNDYKKELEDCSYEELLSHLAAMRTTKAMTDEQWSKILRKCPTVK